MEYVKVMIYLTNCKLQTTKRRKTTPPKRRDCLEIHKIKQVLKNHEHSSPTSGCSTPSTKPKTNPKKMRFFFGIMPAEKGSTFGRFIAMRWSASSAAKSTGTGCSTKQYKKKRAMRIPWLTTTKQNDYLRKTNSLNHMEDNRKQISTGSTI